METHASLVYSSAMAILFFGILIDSFMEQRERQSFSGYVRVFFYGMSSMIFICYVKRRAGLIVFLHLSEGITFLLCLGDVFFFVFMQCPLFCIEIASMKISRLKLHQ